MFRAMSTPTLGVTGVLAVLWLAAAVLGDPDAASGRALDPAVPGSLPAMWATLQLAAVALLGLAVAPLGILSLGPTLLLLGEAGELHALLAQTAFGSGTAAHLWAKAAMATVLGLLAAAPLFRDARSRPGTGTIVAYLVFGGSALALDVGQRGLGGQEALLASLEEWCELALESLLTAAYLAALGNSLLLRRSRCCFG